MLLGSLLVVAALVNNLFPSGGALRRLNSLDWSGYAVASDYSNPQPVIVGISASWVVPTVLTSVDDRFCSVWVGIGGQFEGDETLIQTGSEQDSVNGSAVYSAWYELLPNDSVTITSINMSPGDRMNASISLVNSASDTWLIELEDITAEEKFSQEFVYNSSMLSAEWIVERPSVDNTLSILVDFGSLTFTDAQATSSTGAGVISSFPFSQVIMYDRQNRQLVTVSSLTSKGSSFTVTYSGAVP
jgi:hypothetical protein